MFVSTLGTSRADVDDTVAWRTAEEVRPVPAELRGLPEVRAAKYGLLALAAVGIAAFAVWGAPSNQIKGTFLACFVLVAASVVVLTGWSGQVSLGQMSFVAVGAAVGAKAVGEWDWDVSLALLARRRGRGGRRPWCRHPGPAPARPAPRRHHARLRGGVDPVPAQPQPQLDGPPRGRRRPAAVRATST